MKKRFALTAVAVAIMLPALTSGNGINLNGLGTRAQGMGGAFVSIADDFSAAFWNPAGAAGFGKELFGFYATNLMPRATYSQWPITLEVPRIDAKTPISNHLSFLGAYYRPVGPKVTVGLAIATPSGFGTAWNGEDLAPRTDGTVFSWSSRYRLFAISPLIALNLTRWLSVGATLNVQYGTLSFQRPSLMLFDEERVVLQYEENTSGWGFGASFGVLAKPIDDLAIGLTVRTPCSIVYKGRARMAALPFYGLSDTAELQHDMSWPLWIGGGVSFRPFERLLLSADVQWTRWSKVRQFTMYLDQAWLEHVPIYIDGGGNDFGLPYLGGQDTAQFRFGVEFALNATSALRAGYYSDPSPQRSPGPILFPAHDFKAFTVGIGKTIGDLQLDLGLEYLAGNNWTQTAGMAGYSQGMDIVVPSVSVQYRF